MRRTIALIFVVTILGCSSNDTTTNTTANNLTFPTKPLTIDTDEDGVGADFRLSYTHVLETDTSIVYEVNSTFENKNIGFLLSVPKKGLARLVIKSLGKSSDNFIQALQKLYKLKVDTTSKFVNFITADCMSMGDYVDSLKKNGNGDYVTTAENKLFFQGKSEDDYAELYLNINDTEHWIELKEKDEEYRVPLIRLMTRK